MSIIPPVDMRLLDDVLQMHEGYVLDFSNRSFQEFMRHEVGIDIYADKYAVEGTSKAKRLRFFLRISDDRTCHKALAALWRYRVSLRRRQRAEADLPEIVQDFSLLLQRLGGNALAEAEQRKATETVDTAWLSRLHRDFVELLSMDESPQKRGYAFEVFLNNFFNAYGMEPRSSFRLQGEQIDGSFLLGSDVYLVEAKWQNKQIEAASLRAFNGKVEEKTAWARGLFVSYSGFSQDGLHAFGRGKRLICMDGLDIHEMLDRKLSMRDVIAHKVRRAVETGTPFARVRDLI